MAEASSSNAPAKLSSVGFNDYNTQLQTLALKATKHAVGLPLDLGFHRSIDRSFGREIDACSERVLALTNRLLSLAATADASKSSRGKGKGKLESVDDVVDNFHALVVDPMDQLLERADISLDEFLGRSKPPAIAVNPTQPAQQKAKKSAAPTGRLDPALQHASHIAKPQLSFKRKPDNSRRTIWQPTLKHKYNAQVPLGYNYHDEEESGDSGDASTSLHPYRYEIKHISYPPRMFAHAEPIQPSSFEDTPFTWVDTPAAFSAMLDMLRQAPEIAIDLEYHSYRTFGGFVCLMQISTRMADWVVDTLALRDEMEALNEVFTDAKIVKVLHGADSDIVWMQQDFNLYIVNLFDTYHASKILEFPRHNLATLLEMYCDFTADKRYQLADWRIRPLPAEMLHYARSDTHFLLYIYDSLRNALLDRGQSKSQAASRAQSPSSARGTPPAPSTPLDLIRTVLARSEETALRVYSKEMYDEEGGGPGGWDNLAKKWNKIALMRDADTSASSTVHALQRRVYRRVHAWRDAVAREEDESTRYVLPNHALFALAERPPADMAALLAALHPVPPVVRRRAKEFLDAIRDAVKAELGAGASKEVVREIVQVAEEGAAKEMEIDREEPTASATVETNLWSQVSRPPAAALSSALFGGSTVAIAKAEAVSSKHAAYAAPRSALFGDRVDAAAGRIREKDLNRFHDVMARIHSALAIAPSAPKLPVAAGASEGAVADDAARAKEEEAVEIPFVPAAQRQTQPQDVIDDSIVVVGQARPKKRKRDRTAKEDKGEAKEGSAATTPKEGTPMEDITPFDYSTAPNILDQEEAEGAQPVAKKKKQRQGKGGYMYGNFPAPPKANSQLKSGNQSRTFS